MSDETLLKQQGTAIAQAIMAHGYEVQAIPNCDLIAWQVTRPNENWWAMLAWLPRPVAQWRILPVCSHQYQDEIYRIIEETIESHIREC